MSDLRELYQELILDHSKQPRNYRELNDGNRDAEGFNPLCGDQIHVFLKVEDHTIVDVAFTGKGCAICTASASVMTETLKGKSEADATELFERFHALVTGDLEAASNGGSLGKLDVFSGVSEFPVRVKCASLPWHTLTAALKNQKKAVSTE